jgi:hypothetical protein
LTHNGCYPIKKPKRRADYESTIEKRIYRDVKRCEWFEVGNSCAIHAEETWTAINDGMIDFLDTDHVPHTRKDYKLGDPLKSAVGLV